MRRGTESIPNRGLADERETPFRASASDADRLASLAALTLSRQAPGLILPAIAEIPTSYTYTCIMLWSHGAKPEGLTLP